MGGGGAHGIKGVNGDEDAQYKERCGVTTTIRRNGARQRVGDNLIQHLGFLYIIRLYMINSI